MAAGTSCLAGCRAMAGMCFPHRGGSLKASGSRIPRPPFHTSVGETGLCLFQLLVAGDRCSAPCGHIAPIAACLPITHLCVHLFSSSFFQRCLRWPLGLAWTDEEKITFVKGNYIEKHTSKKFQQISLLATKCNLAELCKQSDAVQNLQGSSLQGSP